MRHYIPFQDLPFQEVMDIEKYHPYQRLDLLYKTNEKKIYLRVNLIVPLYQEESIPWPPKIIREGGNFHEEILEVGGEEVGSVELKYGSYLIEFLQDVNETDTDKIRGKILKKLKQEGFSIFIVRTIITKNPTEEVTNTISEDGDIERD